MIGITAKIGFLLAAAAQAPAPASIEGQWVNPSHSVIINVAQCGETLCGTVQWASQQAQQDAHKNAPHLVGTQLLTDLRPNGNIWEGKLFVPDRNLHVEARLQPESASQLKVSGCEIGICKSQVWTRAQGPVPGSN